jgi:HAD superfamily hydrolase (TIGR01459 family)
MVLSALSRQFPVWLCDVWGVVHDGVKPIASAVTAMQKHRHNGGKVVLITNAPRPSSSVVKHLNEMGVAKSAYDAIVSSGDVTRSLMIAHGMGGLYHLGPEIDVVLFKGLGVNRVELDKAAAVLCTGLLNERVETAKDYVSLLTRMKSLNLTMICANPDKLVRKGDVLVPCAGALAEVYENIGGKVLMAGKPFAPIYDAALELAGRPERSKVLAIGDGPETDIKGAAANDLACLFITGGINTSASIVADVKSRYPAAQIMGTMLELDWT